MPPHASTFRQSKRDERAFTLVEMLVVMAIILVLVALTTPVFNAVSGAGSFTSQVYSFSETIDQARAYAISNGTYVFVGIAEVDSSVAASTVPQVPAAGSRGGRIAVAVVASKDGTKQFADSTSGQGSDWVSNYGNGGKLSAINKLLVFENIHLARSLPVPTTGPMARPTATSTPDTYVLGDDQCVSQTPFTWPLGNSLGGGYLYKFTKVIQLDPRGVARITYPTNGNNVVRWMEADFQPVHGNVVPTSPPTTNSGDQAALQINGITGATRIYRP